MYILSVLQSKQDVSIYPIIMVADISMGMQNNSISTTIVCNNYAYTKLFKSDEKSNNKDLKIPMNDPLSVLDHWS